MNIAAVSKFKHGDMWRALSVLGWKQADLARESGLSPSEIGRFANLQLRPAPEKMQMIQEAFARHGYIFDLLEAWPPAFEWMKKSVTITRYAYIPVDKLLYTQSLHALHEYDAQRRLLKEPIDQVLDTLAPKESEVLRRRFYDNETLEKVGIKFGLSKDRIRRIEAQALRKMRHPDRIRKLEGFIEFGP